MESFTAWDQFQSSLISFIPFFEESDNKIIDLENSEYIILSPIFEQTNLGSFNFISPDIKNIDQNVLLALNFERIRTEEGFWTKIVNSQSGIYYNSFYLVYESKKTLFPLYSKFSELYIQKNLCEIEEYKKQYLKRFETKEDYLNFLNLEEAYILDLLNDEKNIIKSFKLNLDNNGNILCREGEKKDNGDKIDIKTNFSYAILEFDNNLFFTENKYNIVYDEYGKIHYVYVYSSVDYQSLNVPFKFGRYYDDYIKYFGDDKDIDNIYKISERLYEKAKENKILLLLNDDSNLKFHENDCFKLNDDFKTCDLLINRETDASIINHFSKFKISDEILNCDKLLKELDSSSKENFEESVKLFSIDYEKNELIFSKIIQEKEKNLFIADLFKKSDLILSEDDLNWFGEGDVKKSDRYEIYKLGEPYLNDCEEDICNYFVYDISEKKVLYYDNLIYGSFVEFDVSLLFKNNLGEILFNGKTGAFREFERNGLKFYRVYISINDKMNLDFIISEIQMKRILLEYFEE
ncbi:hypothetical protein EOM09_04045 [bacterium]|nr:hypothetical protein [bacterium]